MTVIAYTQFQGLRDALDEATREKQLLINELYCERERVEGEGRRVKMLEERLGESDATNSELERGLREKNEQVITSSEDPSSKLYRVP